MWVVKYFAPFTNKDFILMSRIGKLPIPLTGQIEFTIGADNMVTVKVHKGSISLQLHQNIEI